MAIALSRKPFPVNSVTRLGRIFCSRFLNDSDIGGQKMDSKKVSNCGSSLVSGDKPLIEVVDDDAWRVSSGLAEACRQMDNGFGGRFLTGDWVEDRLAGCEGGDCDSDFDQIDNMRIRGNLFYKLERSSKEFEEYSVEFHRRNGKQKDNKKGSKTKKVVTEKVSKVGSVKPAVCYPSETSSVSVEKKRVRTLTFNQLSGPYHQPFCLDLYISKASVRACIIHRVTSKVVVVAHSISRDMKFDLGSTRNAVACDAVGVVLAQRALADDIHDIVYTPRKGEKIEGKLQIVLQSIIDNGINVKVKLKQRKPRKDGQRPTLPHFRN